MLPPPKIRKTVYFVKFELFTYSIPFPQIVTINSIPLQLPAILPLHLCIIINCVLYF